MDFEKVVQEVIVNRTIELLGVEFDISEEFDLISRYYYTCENYTLPK